MLYMLDTDICSYIVKRRPIAVLQTLEDKVAEGHDICISSVTYAELRFGAERSVNTDKFDSLIDELCERLDFIAPWDTNAADQFARLHAKLLAAGKPIGVNDVMIAGHALSLRAQLVSNNRKHFDQVAALSKQFKLSNWPD